MASICAYLKVLFGALVKKGWVKNMKIHSLNSNLLFWKKASNYTLFFMKSSCLSKLQFDSSNDFNIDSPNFEKRLKIFKNLQSFSWIFYSRFVNWFKIIWIFFTIRFFVYIISARISWLVNFPWLVITSMSKSM